VTEPAEFVLSNARIILADEVLQQGWIAVSHGRILAVGEGAAPEKGLDMGGDTLIPGLVELHTDHLEAHFAPRPGVYWNPLSAVLAYDAQIAASGITTVFDSLRVGQDSRKDGFSAHAEQLGDAINSTQSNGLLRAEHFTHLRCEICSPDVIEKIESYLDSRAIHLMSLNDHTPGQRQFRNMDKWLEYYRGKSGMSEAQLQDFIGQRIAYAQEFGTKHHQKLVEIARANKIAVASHDDTTLDHVRDSIEDGASIAEFPTTIEAAAASHAAGIRVMMGAPNVVRGGSHSGNVSAIDLAHRGTLDVLSSDYVPTSLLMAAWMLPDVVPALSLPAALRMVSKTPAEAVGLTDRGEILSGKRADLARIFVSGDHPVVRTVWTAGKRVA